MCGPCLCGNSCGYVFVVKYQRLIVIVLATLFVASLLCLVKGDVFVSPDENAAFVFAKIWATDGHFLLLEPLNVTFHGLLHARSTLGWGAAVAPVGFLGFPVLLDVS